MMVSSHRVLNNCTLSFFNSTFNEVQDGLVWTLKYSWIIHATCLPVRKRVAFCAASSPIKTSIDDLLEATRYFLCREPRSLSGNSAPMIAFDVFSSAIDFVDSIWSIQIIASFGRRAPFKTSLLKFIRQIRNFANSAMLQIQVFLISFF